MDKDQVDTNESDKGQGSEDEESEEIEEVLEGAIIQDEDSGASEEPMMNLEHKSEDLVQDESTGKSLSYSTEESESSTIDEKQYHEDKEIKLEDKEIDLSHSGQHDTLQSVDDPIISDEDDSDRMELANKLTKSNLRDVVSDTEISEIIMQDPPSDREILEGEEIQKDDESDRNSYIHSVSDDTELNISVDNYMEFPTAMQKTSVDSGPQLESGAYARLTPLPSSTPDKSVDTDDIINAVYDRESVVSDIFEPTTGDVQPSSELSFSRYDSLRSKYTRPRPPPRRPEDPSLTSLPARGVRSYAPFLKSSPLAGMYMGYEQVRLFRLKI